MKRVLVIHHGKGIGGGLIALVGLIRMLRASHVLSVLCIFDSDAVQYLRNEGVNVIVANSKFYRFRYDLFVHSAASFFSVFGLLRNFYTFVLYFLSAYIFAPRVLRSLAPEYDVIYLNSVFISDWARAAKMLNKKVVVHVREPISSGWIGLRYGFIRGVIKRSADRIISISEDNGSRLNLPTRTTVVYDPVVLPEQPNIALEIEPSKRYFTYLGGSQRIKGFEQLVDSLKYLDNNVRIFFLGYTHELNNLGGWKNKVRRLLSAYHRRLPALKAELLVSDRVIHVGVSNDVLAYYRQSVALISPFAASHASLPVLETQFIGKPSIVSDVIGSAEFSGPDTGLIFSNGDAVSLAQAINKMAALDEKTESAISLACKARSRARYKSNPSVSDLIEAL